MRAAGLLILCLGLPGFFAPPARAADPPVSRTLHGTSTTAPQGATPPRSTAGSPGTSGGVRWYPLSMGLEEARLKSRPMLVDVVTDWCGWCKRMDRTTYADEAVREYVGRSFVAIRLDAEDDDRRARYEGRDLTYREFADRFRVTGYPTTLFLTAEGRLITMVPGYVKPERFLTVLRYIGDGHYRSRSWEAYAREVDARGTGTVRP